MALLLAMYQKMRLIREKNQLVLDQSKFSSKLTRIEKNIANQQKRYTSLFSQLESQAQMMQKNATMMFQAMSGLGCGSVNPMDYTGLNGFVTGTMQGKLANGITVKMPGATESSSITMDSSEFENYMAIYMQNGGHFPVQYQKDEAGNTTSNVLKENGVPVYDCDVTHDKVLAFQQAMQSAKMAQDQARMWVQNANTQYGNNVSIWLEAEKARLEAEQEAVLAPLNEQQTMLELDKELTDQRLTRINADLEAYKELCSQEAKNMAPTFGLR